MAFGDNQKILKLWDKLIEKYIMNFRKKIRPWLYE